MQSLPDINEELINILKENIKDPFLLLDQNGYIHSFNQEASLLFSFSDKPGNFYDLLDQISVNKLNELYEGAFQKNNKLEDIFELKLNNGSRLKVQIKIKGLRNENNTLFLLFIKTINNKTILNDKTSLKVKVSEIENIVDNKEVLDVIDEIKSNYPFTFISKNKIRKSIDTLNEFFWIKNIKGTYILVNDKVASSIGLNIIQIEGKAESNFIPHYLVNFQQSIDQYLIESANCIILDGIRFGGLTNPDEYETIEIPLLDSENNITAIIGIGQNKSDKNEHGTIKDLLDHVSSAMAFIDEKDRLKYINTQFSQLYGNKFFDLTKGEYFKFLPANLNEKIAGFIKSSLDEDSFEIIEEEKNLYFTLRKVFNGDTYSGCSIIIEEKYPVIEKKDETKLQINNSVLYDNPNPIFVINKENLKFLEVNDAALILYGYTRDEFLSIDLTDLYNEEDMQSLLSLTAENIKEGIFNGPYLHKRRDGNNVLIEMSKISIIYKGKESELYIISDITKKVELEKNSSLYKAVYDHSDSFLFITDTSGFITSLNNLVTKILGYSKQELENTSFASLFEDSKRGYVNNEIFKTKSINTISFSANIKDASGKFSNFEIHAVPIFNYKNEIDSFAILAKVIQEEAVNNISPEPTEEQTYTSPLLEDSEILSNMFHEILTPINVILGFAQELTESIEAATPEQKEASDIINQNRILLLNTMNTIIDYINISDKDIKLNIEEIKITGIIDNIQNDIKNLIHKNKFELAYGRISSSLVINSDSQKLQNLIYLLITLAAQENKEEKIYISAYQYDKENFAIIIKDNYSFTSDELIRKMNSFIEDRALLKKKLGISKYSALIIKKLLKLLDGSVKILGENNKKEYAMIFPMDLEIKAIPEIESEDELEKEEYLEDNWIDENMPVESDFIKNTGEKLNEYFGIESGKHDMEESEILVEEANKVPKLPRSKLSELRCLYVEDQIDSQMLFKFQMSELKEIKFAVSLEEALPLLKTNSLDFILLDINLQGDYNGIDILKFIHKIPGYETTPIIAATAYLLPGDKEKFIAAGFNDFISKPIFHDNMVDSLKKLF